MMFVFTALTLPLKEKKSFINSELIISSLFIPLSSYNDYIPKKKKKIPWSQHLLSTAKHELSNYHGNFFLATQMHKNLIEPHILVIIWKTSVDGWNQ